MNKLLKYKEIDQMSTAIIFFLKLVKFRNIGFDKYIKETLKHYFDKTFEIIQKNYHELSFKIIVDFIKNFDGFSELSYEHLESLDYFVYLRSICCSLNFRYYKKQTQ